MGFTQPKSSTAMRSLLHDLPFVVFILLIAGLAWPVARRSTELRPTMDIPVADSLNTHAPRYSNLWLYEALNSMRDLEMFEFDLAGAWAKREPAPTHSITATLPVTAESVDKLVSYLSILLDDTSVYSQIILVCPEMLLSTTRRALWTFLHNHDETHPDVDISIAHWAPTSHAIEGIIHATTHALSDWVMLLEPSDLDQPHLRGFILQPHLFDHPSGIRGALWDQFDSAHGAIKPDIRLAAYLMPPFLVSSSLMSDIDQAKPHAIRSWHEVGLALTHAVPNGIPGVLLSKAPAHLPIDTSPVSSLLRSKPSTPPILRVDNSAPSGTLSTQASSLIATPPTRSSEHGTAIILRTVSQLTAFSPAVCRMQASGDHDLHILIMEDSDMAVATLDSRTLILSKFQCALRYVILSSSEPHHDHLFATLPGIIPQQPSVVFLSEESGYIQSRLEILHPDTTYINLTPEDLQFTDWIGSLSVAELQNWHLPRLEISVITNDRPASLTRLFRSLTSARLFGDMPTVLINVDASAQEDNMKVIEEFQVDWTKKTPTMHPAIIVNHRVKQGGLIAAVSESWYPHSNDSYGLLLEDDVELSPMFYAWVKMSLLRYRYGTSGNISPKLFGISLYQQKSTELHPEGRRAFDAHKLFAAENTPYLSQIPCSWGAVYFPEHWREFHEYLKLRLGPAAQLGQEEDHGLSGAEDMSPAQHAQMQLSVPAHHGVGGIVPFSRSNHWAHSWKRYFIELVYLRGYVMLYPNYGGFSSFSTNHLEPGSHVKPIPATQYAKKQEHFFVPLVPLMSASKGGTLATTILDLPGESLPEWKYLPSTDLFGDVVTLGEMEVRGRTRRDELVECSKELVDFSAHSLLCVSV